MTRFDRSLVMKDRSPLSVVRAKILADEYNAPELGRHIQIEDNRLRVVLNNHKNPEMFYRKIMLKLYA